MQITKRTRKLKNFKTKSSHTAETFSELRMKLPFVFPFEKINIWRFDQVIPHMSGSYILSPWGKVFCTVIKNIIENYCIWACWPLLCTPGILRAVSGNQRTQQTDIGRFYNIKFFSKWQRDRFHTGVASRWITKIPKKKDQLLRFHGFKG